MSKKRRNVWNLVSLACMTMLALGALHSSSLADDGRVGGAYRFPETYEHEHGSVGIPEPVGPKHPRSRLDEWALWPTWFEVNIESNLSTYFHRRSVPFSLSVEKLQAVISLLRLKLSSKYPLVRDAAVLALGKLKVSALCSDVGALLEDSSLAVREDALISLGLIGTPEAGKLLQDALGDGDVRSACLLAMSLHGDRRFVPAILKELRSAVAAQDCWAAGEALFALGGVADIDTILRVHRIISVSGMDVLRVYWARAIAEACGRTTGSGNRVALGALQWFAGVRSPSSVRAAALLGLGAFPCDERVLGVLEDGLRGASPTVRVFAVISIGRCASLADGDSESREKFVRALASTAIGAEASDMYVGGYATLMLALLGEESAISPAGRRVLADGHEGEMWEDAAAVAVAAGLVRDAELMPALREIVVNDDLNSELRGYCALALGLAVDRPSLILLRKMLMERSAPFEVLRGCCLALGLIGEVADLGILLSYLDFQAEGAHRSSLVVRGAAAMSIGLMGDLSVVDRLCHTIEKSENIVVQAHAIAALGCLLDRAGVSRVPASYRFLNYRKLSLGFREFLRNL